MSQRFGVVSQESGYGQVTHFSLCDRLTELNLLFTPSSPSSTFQCRLVLYPMCNILSVSWSALDFFISSPAQSHRTCNLCSCPWNSSVTAASSSLSLSMLSTALAALCTFSVSKLLPTPSTVPLWLQILPVHGNPGSENCYHCCFQLPSAHPCHSNHVSSTPGRTSAHTAFVGHFAARPHSWLLFSLLSTKIMRASSTELLPCLSVFTLFNHYSNILLSSHS